MAAFKTSDAYLPTADQPQAIEQLSEGLKAEERYQTLLGATGTGRTATMAAATPSRGCSPSSG